MVTFSSKLRTNLPFNRHVCEHRQLQLEDSNIMKFYEDVMNNAILNYIMKHTVQYKCHAICLTYIAVTSN